MASKTLFQVLSVFLLFALEPLATQCLNPGSPFGFIKHLRGCHKGQSNEELRDLKRYLDTFGYINNTAGRYNDEFDDLLEAAIKRYQLYHRLNATGELNPDTVTEMTKPRCGVPDIVNKNGTNHAHKHHSPRSLFHVVAHYEFMPGTPRWMKNQITYRFRNGVQPSGMDVVRDAVSRAFGRWGQVTGLSFQEVPANSPADIEMGFQRGDHGDGSPFDGPGSVLAHAWGPNRNPSFCHFDADEHWSTNPGSNEVDFESVALHEIGHLLGLAHSQDPNAVMYPTLPSSETKRDLGQESGRYPRHT